MGFVTLDNRTYGDAPYALRPIIPAGRSKAMDEALAAIQAKAPQAALSTVEARANRFRSSPIYFDHCLEIICGGLSFRAWSEIVSYLTGRVEAEAERRWTGFGGEIPSENMKAALIVAREKVAEERAFLEAAE